MADYPFVEALRRIWLLPLCFWVGACGSTGSEPSGLSLRDTILIIPQVDYEPAIYTVPGNPYPQLDLAAVDRDNIIDREHAAIVLENRYVTITLLPEMGRVYSLVPKATGNEVFWHNDTVTVGGGQNPLGWWMWIGGAEYTLPGDEHGTTWAERWAYDVIENSAEKKTVRMSVLERGTGLEENIEITLYADRSFYETTIQISNPTPDTVMFAHWINPMWAPGGHNELTSNTEFIIPTERILIPERFRTNLGESPQDWPTSRLRFIGGWDRGWGDLTADGLEHGFYGAYSHDEEEGVVRVFDKVKNPGVDIWTYGFEPRSPRGIPMGSGTENDGYVEMWGGTSKFYPDERHPIRPGETIEWTEWMYAFHGTGGLTYANEQVAVHFERDAADGAATLEVFATSIIPAVHTLVIAGTDTLLSDVFAVGPQAPVQRAIARPTVVEDIHVRLFWRSRKLAEFDLSW